MFNGFLRDLKSDLIGTRYSPFWDKVVAGKDTVDEYYACTAVLQLFHRRNGEWGSLEMWVALTNAG